MPGITVSEPLNPTSWTTPQQVEVYNALVEILGVSPGCDYPAMTDPQLSASLNDLVAEIRNRPTAVITLVDNIEFGPDVIQVKSDGAAGKRIEK